MTARYLLKVEAPMGVSAAGIFIGFLLFFTIKKGCLRKKHLKKDVNMMELRRYRFDELKKATDSFSDERLIGSGAFGNVYRGVLGDEKRTVAIKKAHSESNESAEEFKNEVELLSRVKHKNLVGLVGYCSEAKHKILVYEYVSQGCLLEYIVGKQRNPLTWEQRVSLAIGSAREADYGIVQWQTEGEKMATLQLKQLSAAIINLFYIERKPEPNKAQVFKNGVAHLHGGEPSIIHRDLKPSNILIDDEFEAKISDFGLVKKGPNGDASHVSTQVKGTPGYMDPAYCSSLHLTTSSDIFSFGVILLQLVSSKPVLDHTRRQSEYHISNWAKPSIERGMVEDILDSSLQLEPCNNKMMLKMAQLGIRCTAWEPKNRPTIRQVVKELEEALCQVTKSVQRSSYSEESQSFSTDNVLLQRFYVESFEDISIRSASLRCLDVTNSSNNNEEVDGV